MKKEVSVIIPNYNGRDYLVECLKSLKKQRFTDFELILVDNASADDSVKVTKELFPEAKIRQLSENFGFCRAVNEGIRLSKAPFVLLLNNDTVVDEDFVGSLYQTIKERKNCFSCASQMRKMCSPELMDDGGNYYCALGWAFALGKDRPFERYQTARPVFAACAGAAIYRREIFREIGLFDETHFAYLEDMDVGYRARIYGYENWYEPRAIVYHVGSGTTGSRYNEFKVRYSARNNLYMLYKNMPVLQLLLNLPLLLAGFLIKYLFFARKGMGREYRTGLKEALKLFKRQKKVSFQVKNLKNYLVIQGELWINIVRRLRNL